MVKYFDCRYYTSDFNRQWNTQLTETCRYHRFESETGWMEPWLMMNEYISNFSKPGVLKVQIC